MKAQLLVDSQNILGEGARWHTQRASFMWVDIEGQKVCEYNFDTSKVQTWDIGFKVSLIIETENPSVVRLAVQGGIVQFHLENKELVWEIEIEKDNLEIRTNDGSIDPLGRLWIGTMRLDCAADGGALYGISKENTLTKKLFPTSISNGMVWTKDYKRLYYIDSVTYKVASYHFDLETGDIAFEKDIIHVPQTLGMPDGMCQDEAGMLWIAVWGGAGVYQYNPQTGQQIGKIEIPAPYITSCVFDPHYKRLFITTARVGMTAEELLKYPLSGGVFVYSF